MAIRLGGNGTTATPEIEKFSGSLGGENGRGRISDLDFEDPHVIAEINITPLTDIFLVLLIIFMVTSSVLSQMGVQVQLPKSTQASSANPAPGVIVTVTKEGAISVNGTHVADEKLREILTLMLGKTSEKTVVLEGDRLAVLGTVVRIMDEAKKAGAAKFAVATQTEGGK